MHGSKTVSVVLPAYNEEGYIRPAVEDFFVPAVVDELAAVLRSLKESISILLVEQNLRMALDVADNVLVLQRGRVVLEGSPEDVAEDPKLQAVIVV